MKNGDLKVVRVYTQDGKQVAFDVQNATGTQQVDKATVVGTIKNGHSYVNATVTSSGVVRVDSNVPRQPIKQSSNINTSLAPYNFKSDNMGYAGVCFSSNLDEIKRSPIKHVCNKPAKRIFIKTFELAEPYDKYFDEELCADKSKYIKRITDYLNKHYPKEQGYGVLWDSNFSAIPELLFTTNEDGEPVYDFDGLVHTKCYIFKNSDVNCEEDTFDYQSYVLFAIEHLKTLIEWISKGTTLTTFERYGYNSFLHNNGYGNYIDVSNTYNCLCLNSPTLNNICFRGCGFPIFSDDNCVYLTFCDKNVYKKLLPLYKKLDEVMYKKQHK